MLDTPRLTFQSELLSISYNCPLHDKVQVLSNIAKKHKSTNIGRIPLQRQEMLYYLGTIFKEEKKISLGW